MSVLVCLAERMPRLLSVCPGQRVALAPSARKTARSPQCTPARYPRASTTATPTTPITRPPTPPPSSPPRAAWPATGPDLPPPAYLATTPMPPFPTPPPSCPLMSVFPMQVLPTPPQDPLAPTVARCRGLNTPSHKCRGRRPFPLAWPLPTSPAWEECPSWCPLKIRQARSSSGRWAVSQLTHRQPCRVHWLIPVYNKYCWFNWPHTVSNAELWKLWKERGGIRVNMIHTSKIFL